MEVDRCPKCNGFAIVAGYVAASGGSGPAYVFVPHHVRLLRMKDGVQLEGANFRCCPECGHVWASLNVKELRDFIEAYGDALLRQDIQPLGTVSSHDPSAKPEVEAAVRGVTEIDALMRAGNQAKATRRYRDLSACTWDQAIDTVRGWRDFDWNHKLSLFGSGKSDLFPDGQSDLHDHPMRDRLLDE